MVELPIEKTRRISVISNRIDIYPLSSQEVDYSVLLSQLVMLNKIVYCTDCPTFQHNGKVISCSAFRLKQFIEILDGKFIEGEVFCFYNIFNTNSSTSGFGGVSGHNPIWMIRGAFVEVGKEFVLRDVIDRDDQISKILSN